MRFRGGGVGHKATHERTEPMSQEADTTVPDDNEDDIEEDGSFGDGESEEEGPGSDGDNPGEQSDGDGDSDEAEAGEEAGELEDDFDGEDGEEPWEIDKYTAEGYAPP